jgi:MFS family permease
MFGMLGFFVGPSMIGLISEYYGLRVSFYFVAVVIALMIPAILALAKQKRPGKSTAAAEA